MVKPTTLEHWLTEGAEAPPVGTKFVGLDALIKSCTAVALHKKISRPLFFIFSTRAEARNFIDNLDFFAGKAGRERVHYLPAIEFDFHRGLVPNPEIFCERNTSLLHALNDAKNRIFVTTTSAFIQKAVPPMEFLRATKSLSEGDEISRENLTLSLLEAGYQRQPTAFDPGTFSIRGGVVDVFCPLYPKPIRLEFFGDLIEEIRFFDPKTQLSQEKLPKAFLIPVGISLFPHGEDLTQAVERVKERLDHQGIMKSKRDEVIESVREGMLLPEQSFLFPLLSNGSDALTEYFPADTVYIWDEKGKILEEGLNTEFPKAKKHYELFEKAPLPIAAWEDLFLTEEQFKDSLLERKGYSFEALESESPSQLVVQSEPAKLKDKSEGGKGASPALMEHYIATFREWMEQGYRIHIACHTSMHAEHLLSLFRPYGIHAESHEEGTAAFPSFFSADFSRIHLWQGFLSQSQVLPRLRLVLLSEEILFGHKKRTARSASWSQGDADRLLSTFRELKTGDYVVHRDFGVGRYLGLKSMDFQGVANDYVLLEYQDGDKLYIPIYRLNVLQKYVGGEGATIALDKLGGEAWTKAKSKASRAIAELAVEFLNLQAKRRLVPAFPFSTPGTDYEEFEMQFPFDETQDQQKAIDDVQRDLGKPHPMDRLVCGDVGYGKTEVAMRAACRALCDSKQAAILVPTTVLAFQHFENFKKRFQNTPARIDMICRLRSSQEVKKTLEQLREGKIDIIIGTHRLLSADVQFKDFGLLVIDEEHRFGVVHKERLKKMAESVHVMSMTATPIPRTLNMAMTGIKEISIITTPPPDRLSVRTFVCRKSDEVIFEAIQNELARDGQVFFVHNRIDTLFGIADDLRKLFPKVKLEIVHGQMDGDTLEQKMLTFYRGEAQVLLTTSIIESGLDIPRANTIIIDKADHLGLAQLYQLRGRVGRSEKRAYCYLLVPNENQLTADAKQRLQVIQRYSDLGGGFQVASHDLEIRGAGDLLGKDQSGHINAIGVDLYFELLDEALRELKGQPKSNEIEPEITMKIPAYFPNDYLPDVGERVQIYRRLSGAKNREQLSLLESEIRDRFGALPIEVQNLLGLMTIKLHLKQLHVTKMNVGPKKTSLQFAPSTPARPEKLVKMITKNPASYQLTPDHKFVFSTGDPTWQAQLLEIRKLCDLLEVEIPSE